MVKSPLARHASKSLPREKEVKFRSGNKYRVMYKSGGITSFNWVNSLTTDVHEVVFFFFFLGTLCDFA